MIKKLLPVLFFVVLVLDNTAIVTNLISLRFFSKPLLMPILMLFYYFSVNKVDYMFLITLFFALIGDYLLLDDSYFVFGLASFLITHILFTTIISKFIKKKSLSLALKCFTLFLVYFLAILSLIHTELESNMLMPIICYGLAISSFGVVSLMNFLVDKSKDNFKLAFAAGIFIASDSLIAISKYYIISFEYIYLSMILKMAVMITYGISQFLICQVFINRANKNQLA